MAYLYLANGDDAKVVEYRQAVNQIVNGLYGWFFFLGYDVDGEACFNAETDAASRALRCQAQLAGLACYEFPGSERPAIIDRR